MGQTVRLSRKLLEAIKPGGERVTLWDDQVPGFGIRVATSGALTFVLKYRVGGGRSGQQRWASIGRFGPVTVDQARDIARRWYAEVIQGGDPGGDRLARRVAPTVAELLKVYLSDHARPRNKASTAAEAERLVNKVIVPALGRAKVADVTLAAIEKFHAGLRDTPFIANRSVALLSKAFSLAERWGWRPGHSNPCRGVTRYPEQPRERYLTAEEFAALGRALDLAEDPDRALETEGARELALVSWDAVQAIRLLIFTGARKGEILGLRWEHLSADLSRATLPDSKTGKKVLQIPPPAQAVLARLARPAKGRGFVIRGGRTPEHGRALVNLAKPWERIRAAAGLHDLRIHDLRHAYASAALAGGVSLDVIGELLGHRELRTTKRYAHLADDIGRRAAGVVAARIAQAMDGPIPPAGETRH